VYERWCIDTWGSQRQYMVQWKHGKGRMAVVADDFDSLEQHSVPVNAWKQKCLDNGEVVPMPAPDVRPTNNFKYYDRKF
jgi:hypothetical protein